MLFPSKQHNKIWQQIGWGSDMRSWYKPKLSIVFWFAAAVWCGALFYFSGQDGAESSELSLLVSRLVLRALPFLSRTAEELNPILRKAAHFGGFAAEGFLLGAAMMTALPEPAVGGVLAALSCAIVAVLNEYHQSFVDGRACEVKDMLIDSGGALTGVLLAALLLLLAFRIARRRTNVRI